MRLAVSYGSRAALWSFCWRETESEFRIFKLRGLLLLSPARRALMTEVNPTEPRTTDRLAVVVRRRFWRETGTLRFHSANVHVVGAGDFLPAFLSGRGRRSHFPFTCETGIFMMAKG